MDRCRKCQGIIFTDDDGEFCINGHRGKALTIGGTVITKLKKTVNQADNHHYVYCVNCGRQTRVEGKPRELCIFCHLSPYFKSYKPEKEIVTMSTKAGKRQKYFEENKEAIIKDYQSLTVPMFLRKWRLSTNTWRNLRNGWNVASKSPGRLSCGKSAHERHKLIEEHKQEILADMPIMSVGGCLEKWGLGQVTYYKLRKLIPEVSLQTGPRPSKPLASEGVAPLTEREHYLVLLGYQQGVREMLKDGKNG